MYNYGWDDDAFYERYNKAKTIESNASKPEEKPAPMIYDEIAYVGVEESKTYNEDGTQLNHYALYDDCGDIFDYYESEKKYTSASECVRDYLSEIEADDVREVEHGAVWI